MDGIGAGDGGGGNDRRHVQIRITRWRWADADTFICQAHMHRIGIRGGMYGNGSDTHFAAGAMDAKRDFAAIGNQDFFKHRALSLADW
jgi:hypothetical protein